MQKIMSTSKDFADMVEQRNTDGRYDQLIANARSHRYHDYKNPDDVICGKVELAADLMRYPELKDLRDMVINGAFDETMDEEDKENMRNDLPASMWNIFGL